MSQDDAKTPEADDTSNDTPLTQEDTRRLAAKHMLVYDDKVVDLVEDALVNLWAVVNDLSQIRPHQNPHYRVCVFGSARIKPGQPLYNDVKHLAKSLAELGCDIVTGGGPGLMEAANEGENLGDPDGKTRSYGIRIELPFEDGANPYVEKDYIHRTFYSRLHQFVRLSSAFVVVGGGIGTALETMLVWQLLQVNHVTDRPLIFVGEMWHDLVRWAKRHMLSHEPPFASEEDLDLPICVDSMDEAVEIIRKHKANFTPKPIFAND